MSETTREVLDSYQKVFSGDCYKNMEKIVAAVGAACKSLMQVNGNEQIQAWQDALYDPESSINKSIRAWSKYPKQIKIEELAGLQVGLQKLVDYIPQYDIKSLSLLQTFLLISYLIQILKLVKTLQKHMTMHMKQQKRMLENQILIKKN